MSTSGGHMIVNDIIDIVSLSAIGSCLPCLSIICCCIAILCSSDQPSSMIAIRIMDRLYADFIFICFNA